MAETVEYNLLFRWFLALNFTDASRDNLTFTKDQQRLLEHSAPQSSFDRIVGLATEYGWGSDAQFTVDGSLIEAWASLKSVDPREGPPPSNGGDPGNLSVDFRRQRRTNDTHQSTTDPQARLARLTRKGRDEEARLCYGLHALMENRNALCIGARLDITTEVTESPAAAADLGVAWVTVHDWVRRCEIAGGPHLLPVKLEPDGLHSPPRVEFISPSPSVRLGSGGGGGRGGQDPGCGRRPPALLGFLRRGVRSPDCSWVMPGTGRTRR